MSWFQNSGFADLAKNALSSAQKTIDRALDIHHDDKPSPITTTTTTTTATTQLLPGEPENFFAAFGLESAKDMTTPDENQPLKTKTAFPQDRPPIGAMSGSLWGSFTGSFFDTKNPENTNPNPDFKSQLKNDCIMETPKALPVSNPRTSTVKLKDLGECTTVISLTDNPDRETIESATPENVQPSTSENQSNPSFVIIQQPSNVKNDAIGLPPNTEEKVKLNVSFESFITVNDASGLAQTEEESATTSRNIELLESGKSEETSTTPTAESTSVELLDRSTDSTETIKDDHCEEIPSLLVADRENPTDSDQTISTMWEWDSKLMTISETVPTGDDTKESSSEDSTTSELPKELLASNNQGNMEDSEQLNKIASVHEHDKTAEDESKHEFPLPEIKQEAATEDDSKVVNDMDSKSTESISSSFVKCMIEEAMGEQELPRSQSPHSTTSSSEKSELLKIGSEQNSGHTSGDEVETTTSSDIEIISMSSPNGEMLDRLSLSPIKQIWVGKPGGRFRRGERADSPASDSSSMRDSPMSGSTRSDEKFIPISNMSRNKTAHLTRFQGERKRPPDVSDGESQVEIHRLMKKLAEMTELLHARETRLLELSRENISLQETNCSVKKQLQQAEETHVADARDVTTLTEELSQRLSIMERNLQQALKEKEHYMNESQQNKEAASTRLCPKAVETMINEKDDVINQLRQEGDKLSKQQLQQNNVIKKLRAKEKDTENLIKKQKSKLGEQEIELERCRKSLSAKEEVECNQIDAIRQLTNKIQTQDKEIATLKSDLEDSQEKVKSMKSVLDSSYKELAELHRSNVQKDSQVQEASLSAEMSVREELRIALEKAQQNARREQESLVSQIEDLHTAIKRTEHQASRREDNLRHEVADLQQRLQEEETRNQELSQNVSAATRPLLRQIENLQATFSNQSSSWEKLEQNLTDRLAEAQAHLSSVVEKERSATERYMEASSRLSSLEAQCNLLRNEKTRLQAELETKKAKLEMLQEWKTKESVQVDLLKQSFAEEMAELKRELQMAEHQLDIEKTVLEAEKRKSALLQDQLKEKERRNSQVMIHQSSNRTTPSPTLSLSKFSSVSESFNPWIQDDNLESSLMLTSNSNRLNLYDTLRQNGATSFLEGLQSQLKLKEGEIVQLQNEIAKLEKIRESMAQELVRVSTQNEDFEDELKQFQEQQTKFQDMEQKYNALLQMYGEKTEEADELQLDLQDIKEMYKAQINELMEKS